MPGNRIRCLIDTTGAGSMRAVTACGQRHSCYGGVNWYPSINGSLECMRSGATMSGGGAAIHRHTCVFKSSCNLRWLYPGLFNIASTNISQHTRFHTTDWLGKTVAGLSTAIPIVHVTLGRVIRITSSSRLAHKSHIRHC